MIFPKKMKSTSLQNGILEGIMHALPTSLLKAVIDRCNIVAITSGTTGYL